MSEKEPLEDIRGWEVKLVITSCVIILVVIGILTNSVWGTWNNWSILLIPTAFGFFGITSGMLVAMRISLSRSGKHATWREQHLFNLYLREVEEEIQLERESAKRMEEIKLKEEKHLANARIEGVVERI